jgi:competence protein ComEC
MKRPLVAVVSCYITGLLLGEFFQPPLVTLFLCSFLILILAFVLGKFRPYLLCALLALAGWTNLGSRTAVVSPNDLRSLMGNDAALVAVRGTLAETPNTRIFLRDEEAVQRSLARVRVNGLRRANDAGWKPACGTIVVTTPGVLPANFFARQPVEISGVLTPPDAPRAEGLFDYRNHLKQLGIFYALKTASSNDWQLRAAASARPPLSDRFIAWAERTLTLGLDASDQSTQLLLAMTLGRKTALTDEVSEPFMRSGTMHIFAISGLHIALIAGILLGLLRVIQLPRIACGWIVLPLIWFYTAATGWQPSAIRSTIMMTVVIGGWMLKRPGDLLNSLAAAAFIILLWDPRQLFQASFQLSFFVVLSIALIAPPLNKIRDRLLQTDPMLPASLLPRWWRWADAPLRWGTTCLTTSLAAWAGSLPLTAYYFHLFSPVTLLANVIIVPLAGFALMAELGSVVCGSWFPWATELFNNAAWLFMHSIVGTGNLLTKIPGSFFYVPAPHWILIAVYYAFLAVVMSGWLKTMRRKIVAGGALALIVVVYIGCSENSRGATELTVLPLNGGHAVFVDGAGRKNDWLVDCGNESAVEFTLKPFLRAHGVNKIPRLILTEGDVKNVGGAQRLDDLLGIGELWTSPVHFRSAAYNHIVAAFEKSPGRRRLFNGGQETGCWQALWPVATNNFSRADDNALVLLGNFSGTKILLLSDLGRAGQSELLARTNDLRADIVVAGLPDASEPLANALLDAVQPKVIVIADSEFPATRRASRELKERLALKQIPLIYTHTAGAVKIVTGESGWKLRTMDGQIFSSP